MARLKDKAILTALLSNHWAMEPQVLARMADVVLRHANGIRLSDDEIREAIGRDPGADSESTASYEISGPTAVIGISGILAKHASMVNGSSQPQGTGMGDVQDLLDKALADPTVKNILLRIDSPGGTVSGTADLADKIASANQEKPVVAFAEDLAASAAYWLGSQAGRFLANRTAAVGSIGVYAVVIDSSRAAENEGVRVDVVRAGALKGRTVPGAPVTEEARDSIQSEVNALYDQFVSSVADGRRLSDAQVRAISDGRVWIGRAAVDAGLIDGISTYRKVLAEMAKGNVNSQPANRRNTAVPSARAEGGTGEKNMEEKQNDTAVAGEELIAKARAEAVAQERQRVGSIEKALGQPWQAEIRAKAIAEGLSLAAASELVLPVAEARVAALEATVAEQNAKLDTIAKGGVKPLEQAANDDQVKLIAEAARIAAEANKPAAFDAKVAEAVKAGMSKSVAIATVSASDPDLYSAWLDKANEARK